MASITDISNTYVRDFVALSPLMATFIGLPGDEDQIDDLSPDGLSERHALGTAALAELAASAPASPDEEIAEQVIVERLQLENENYEAGYQHADLNVIGSPLQQVRMVFDLMEHETGDDWATISRRMAAVPAALRGYQASLMAGVSRSVVPAQRQVDRCAAQCRTYAGLEAEPGFFSTLAAQAGDLGVLGPELAANAQAAEAGYADLSRFLLEELRPHAPELDAVGERRYSLALRDFTGARLDLAETYRWGWEEFLSIESDMAAVAARLTGGGSAAEAAGALDSDPAHQLHGAERLQAWMQELSDQAIAGLGRTHFDVPAPLETLECRIAPPGGGAGAYYIAPSDDLSRPGRMWFSLVPGLDTFYSWRETTVVYHEGVPGHHLQVGIQVYQRANLNDFQRLFTEISGHAEGWALYAERLVRELGYLDDPALLGMLNDQLFRAARVVLDIGMHLQYKIPSGTGFHEGERWTPGLGLEFLRTRTITEPTHARDEIDRYLGWPGQAPSYKVGERVWLDARSAAQLRHGAAFDLKAFHTAALKMGAMGLDPLRVQLAKL